MLFSLLLSLASLTSQTEPSQCDSSHQQAALNLHTKHKCSLVTEVVKLDIPQSEGNIIHVTPSHVTVRRCRGSCPVNRAFSCRAKSSMTRRVPVMMVVGGFKTGLLETVCSSLEATEDTECECGCEVRPEDCQPDLHLYSNQTCSCSCPAQEQCGPGKTWDSWSCRCVCTQETHQDWSLCSTGHLFDSQDTCGCVPVHHRASLPAAVLTVLMCLLAVCGLLSVLLYSRQTEDRRRRESLARILDEDTDEEEVR